LSDYTRVVLANLAEDVGEEEARTAKCNADAVLKPIVIMRKRLDLIQRIWSRLLHSSDT
jgi:hypothetical protein